MCPKWLLQLFMKGFFGSACLYVRRPQTWTGADCCVRVPSSTTTSSETRPCVLRKLLCVLLVVSVALDRPRYGVGTHAVRAAVQS
jgi:hypothetical protein